MKYGARHAGAFDAQFHDRALVAAHLFDQRAQAVAQRFDCLGAEKRICISSLEICSCDP